MIAIEYQEAKASNSYLILDSIIIKCYNNGYFTIVLVVKEKTTTKKREKAQSNNKKLQKNAKMVKYICK